MTSLTIHTQAVNGIRNHIIKMADDNILKRLAETDKVPPLTSCVTVVYLVDDDIVLHELIQTCIIVPQFKKKTK